jgi:chromate transporter
MFWIFAKIGAFTLGGGYAMVPLIQSEVVDKKEWVKKDEFIDILAVAQSTPGALAVNMASFIGYRLKGVAGAVSATLGCVLPSFITILIIAAFFTRVMGQRIVERAFMGIRPAVAALIAFSVIKIAKTSNIKPLWYIVSAVAVLFIIFVDMDPILIILLSGVFGVIFGVIKGARSGQDDN